MRTAQESNQADDVAVRHEAAGGLRESRKCFSAAWCAIPSRCVSFCRRRWMAGVSTVPGQIALQAIAVRATSSLERWSGETRSRWFPDIKRIAAERGHVAWRIDIGTPAIAAARGLRWTRLVGAAWRGRRLLTSADCTHCKAGPAAMRAKRASYTQVVTQVLTCAAGLAENRYRSAEYRVCQHCSSGCRASHAWP